MQTTRFTRAARRDALDGRHKSNTTPCENRSRAHAGFLLHYLNIPRISQRNVMYFVFPLIADARDLYIFPIYPVSLCSILSFVRSRLCVLVFIIINLSFVKILMILLRVRAPTAMHPCCNSRDIKVSCNYSFLKPLVFVYRNFCIFREGLAAKFLLRVTKL